MLQVINIEVDGPRHRFPSRKTFAERRDEYLRKQHGVAVHRIDVAAMDIENDIDEDGVFPLLDEVFMRLNVSRER